MDLSQLPDLAPLGIGGALVAVIYYLLRVNHVDRAQQREVIEAMTKAHRAETDALDERIRRLEKRADDLDREVDGERALRRKAEDIAAAADRRAVAAEANAALLTQMLERGSFGADSSTTAPFARPATQYDPTRE